VSDRSRARRRSAGLDSPHRDVDHDALEGEEDAGQVEAGADDGHHPARARRGEEGEGESARSLA